MQDAQIRHRNECDLKEELLVELPYFAVPAGAQATVKALHERNVRVRVLTNSLASNDMLPAHWGYAKTRGRAAIENGMELYELRPDTDASSGRAGRSSPRGRQAALHAKAMAFDGESRVHRHASTSTRALP